MPQISPELLAAQQRLLKLREQLSLEPALKPEAENHTQKSGRSLLDMGQAMLQQRRAQEVANRGGRVSGALKIATTIKQADLTKPGVQIVSAPLTEDVNKNTRRKIKVYPSLAIGMLEAGLAAPGRLYWLLRFLDQQGQGWLDVDFVRHRLTSKKSDLQLCSWRRLRQLFSQGENIFWSRDCGGRIWIAGAALTARNLSVSRLEGCPVEMPVKTLLGGIQAVRAHFYASFHSCKRSDNPISRQSLRQLTSVPERTQLDYDKAAKVQRQENLAIGEQLSGNNTESRAWKQGQAIFHFLDVKGRQGPAGREYIAWHLPNSYQGPHAKRNKGRQKKINQQLVDLVMKGMRGNGSEQVKKIFWPHGAAAAKAHNQDSEKDAYWQNGSSGCNTLWLVIPGEG